MPDVYNSKLYKHLSMNWNFLMTWFIMKTYPEIQKIFVIEEDVFINADVGEIFKLNTHGYIYTILSLGGTDFPDGKRYEKFKAWLSCMNIELTVTTWIHKIVNKKVYGGPRFHVIEKMPVDYEERITKVYTNEEIYNHKSNRWHCGYYDELFHTVVENDESVSISHLCKPHMARLFTRSDCQKWINKKAIYHFNGSSKREKLSMIKQLKGIK